jgi:hypothetical protein
MHVHRQNTRTSKTTNHNGAKVSDQRPTRRSRDPRLHTFNPSDGRCGGDSGVDAMSESVTIDRDITGTMHIKIGEFDFIQIQYQHPFTDNAGTKKLAERIVKLLAQPEQPAGEVPTIGYSDYVSQLEARIAELEAELAALRDQVPAIADQKKAFDAYLFDCGCYQIQPDVAGAFNWAWSHAAPVAKPQGEFGDAYQGAREDLAIWKRRALDAEKEVFRQEQIIDRMGEYLNDLNGPTFMGEPVLPAAKPRVVMPEHMDKQSAPTLEQILFILGWNECLDEFTRLNAADQEGDV